jgi:hypothetical protein
MPDVIPDLWPTDIINPPKVWLPKAIMAHQAEQLKAKSYGAVSANIETRYLSDTDLLIHSFDLEVPKLSYGLRLFVAKHKKEMVYPVTVESDACSVSLPVAQRLE